MPMTWGGVAGDGKTLKFNNKNRILRARDSGWASTDGFFRAILSDPLSHLSLPPPLIGPCAELELSLRQPPRLCLATVELPQVPRRDIRQDQLQEQVQGRCTTTLTRATLHPLVPGQDQCSPATPLASCASSPRSVSTLLSRQSSQANTPSIPPTASKRLLHEEH
ncbi:predicted protein [Histoplasma capsulatum G186AR]|uniref:Uncharacterized protein n=1 Tax=Ajellomyces capsulatus (strain G186AR / H82 / ATCC MYA-2454 / RMSCC 2432) TaxID=447093 RepID=C0NT37_AJECG|nr:uncharacterized protein HCBG_06317 [Histoplasma capsulatum G186AR]EEH05198.1 predicted protein [Histoplasma capsulatum G186AR]